MKRRLMAALLAATLVFGSSMTVWASEARDEGEEAVSEEVSLKEADVPEVVEEPDAEVVEEVAEVVELAENSEEPKTFPSQDENGLTWNLVDGKLTITGSGEIKSPEYYEQDKWMLTSEQRQEVVSLEIGEGITKIYPTEFMGWDKLESVTLPNTVTEIMYDAFSYCKSLPEVTIPESVKKIGSEAFGECTSLKTITFKGDAPENYNTFENGEIGERYPIFDGVTATVYYPGGNQTYTEEVKASYGGNLTWVEQFSFTDVPADESCWYRDYVNYVASKGIMTGMTDTNFGAGVDLPRSHFATIIYRIAGEPSVESDKSVFPDVPDNDFYTKAAAWAKENDIIKGYDDGNFGPNDKITREDMAVIMYRYAQSAKLDTTAAAELDSFPDAEKVSPYAVEALKWAVGKGIITGKEDTEGNKTIEPQGNASRAQCAAVIQRFMEGYDL